MTTLSRRAAVAATAASALLPRFAIAQGDQRPALTVAVQIISTSNTLDVLAERSNVGERMFESIYESLYARNLRGDLSPIPRLATSWRRIDERTVELKIRPGVKFHDGETMTVEDVAFTFSRERMFGPVGADGVARGRELGWSAGAIQKELPPQVRATTIQMFPNLEGVDIVDRETVRFVNRTPDVTLEGRIARYGCEIISRRAYEAAPSFQAWAVKPVATGPYMVAEFVADQSLTLVPHEAYWGGRPPARMVKFVTVPEVASRVNGLLSGQYQFIADMPPDQIPLIEANPRFEVQGGLIGNHRIMVFDRTHAVLADPRIRRALTHAIDRQLIVDTLWSGRTVVPKGLQWEYYGPMFLDDWAVPKFDLAEAKRLLREAGYRGQPIPYRCLNNYYTNQTSTGQIVAAMWQEAGINVELQMVENWNQIMLKNDSRAIRDWSNSASFADPVSSLVAQHGPRGGQQTSGEWTNAEFNRLSDELETSVDMERRRGVFRRMLEIAEREDPAFTVLHRNATFTGLPKALKWKTAPAFAMDFGPGNLG